VQIAAKNVRGLKSEISLERTEIVTQVYDIAKKLDDCG
jgi:hypothetical protein